MAFAPKKRETTPSRRAFMDSSSPRSAAAAAATTSYCPDEVCVSPPFMKHATSYKDADAAALAAQYEEDWDDDTVVGYGTGIVACVVSLALGFSLGYVTL